MTNVYSYGDICNTGLIECISNIEIDENHGRLVKLSEINTWLLGIDECPKQVTENTLVVLEMAIKKKNICYLKLKKFFNYLNHIKTFVNFDIDPNYIPINYYRLMKEIDIPEHYLKLINFFDSLHQYLSELDTPESKTINHYIGIQIFKGRVSYCIENPFSLLIEFYTPTRPFFIGFNNISSEPNFINLENTNNKDQLDVLVKFLVERILMSNPENYMIHNMTRVTGNEIFAKMIITSYLDKDDYIVDSDELNNIINFKNDTSMKKYQQQFVRCYHDSNIYHQDKNKLYLNFEGFNKYLLNLEVNYLLNFGSKEEINQLYYCITQELIQSYEKLYYSVKF